MMCSQGTEEIPHEDGAVEEERLTWRVAYDVQRKRRFLRLPLVRGTGRGGGED